MNLGVGESLQTIEIHLRLLEPLNNQRTDILHGDVMWYSFSPLRRGRQILVKRLPIVSGQNVRCPLKTIRHIWGKLERVERPYNLSVRLAQKMLNKDKAQDVTEFQTALKLDCLQYITEYGGSVFLRT